jgi:uncharacterized protein (TIGR00251 family)
VPADGREAILHVRVIPRSPRTRVDGRRGDAILIRLAAPPVEGAANEALIAFLSAALRVPKRDVRIAAGAKSRDKTVAIAGMTAEAALAALGVAR